MGLVKLVVESQTKRNVQRLTQTYLTLSLEDIAAAVNLPSAAAAELVILRCRAYEHVCPKNVIVSIESQLSLGERIICQVVTTGYLPRMIDAGEIFACIDSEKSMVRFLGDPEQYASPAMVQRLDAAIQQPTTLAERVSAVTHAVRPSEHKHLCKCCHHSRIVQLRCVATRLLTRQRASAGVNGEVLRAKSASQRAARSVRGSAGAGQ